MGKIEEAKDWLTDFLQDGNPVLSHVISSKAKEINITDITIQRAKNLLPIVVSKKGRNWQWQLQKQTYYGFTISNNETSDLYIGYSLNPLFQFDKIMKGKESISTVSSLFLKHKAERGEFFFYYNVYKYFESEEKAKTQTKKFIEQGGTYNL